MRRFRRGPRDEGAAAVEFALVLPVLLVVLFGIINFAGLFSTQLALNNGVRQAARQAVVAGSNDGQTCASMVGAVQSASSPPLGVNASTIAVKVTRVSTVSPSTTTATPCGTAFNTTSGSNTTRVCDGSASNSSGATESILVEARIPAKFLAPMPVPGFSNTYTLTAKAVYRCEFSS